MEKKKRQSISAFTILILIIILLAFTTYLFPQVENATLATVVMAPYKGFVEAIDVCGFILVLGGFLGVLTKTGALDTGIKSLVNRLNGKEIYLIPLLMILFALGGTTFGMSEETIGFYALVTTAMVAAGFDTLVSVATIMLGAGVGCIGSTVNPFATGIASDSLVNAGIALNQGIIIGIGLLLTIVNLIICIYYVMSYAKKVKFSNYTVLSKEEQNIMNKEFKGKIGNKVTKLNTKQKYVLSLFAFAFIVMVIAVIPWDSFIPQTTFDTLFGWTSFLNGLPLGMWWFGELSMWFLILSIIVGVVGGLKEKEIVDSFLFGAADIVGVVLVIAIARGASVLMSSTGLDTFILASAANLFRGLSAIIFAPISFLFYIGLSFLIPSSSGLATATMPIMGPLTVGIGYNPAVMVMIFSAASGIVNLFTPTSGVVMGGLQIAKVEYSTWLKWAIKVIVTCLIVSMIILTIAMIIL